MKALKGAFFDDFFKGGAKIEVEMIDEWKNLLIYIFRNNFKRNWKLDDHCH